MKALVTGGAGFIGSHLCDALVKQGYTVIALDNLSITSRNIKGLEDKGVHLHIADITDALGMFSSFKDVDVVFHLAAMNRAIKSINEPWKANDVNVTGTLNVLEACRKFSVPKVVFSSSSSVYGSSPVYPRVETQMLCPSHPYAVGKMAAEGYMKVYNELYGVQTAVLRYFSVYGSRQLGNIEHAAAIPKFMDKICRGEEITVYGDGLQTRSFTHVDDVVRATILASKNTKANGETINISSGSEVGVKELIHLIEKATGKNAKVRHIPAIKGEVAANPANIDKAKKILGFEPKMTLKKGLEKTMEWYRKEYLDKR